MRQLRNTRRLKAWLRAGKTVELQERNKVIAHIVPATEQAASGELPDFAARRKNVFGDRVLLGADLLIEERCEDEARVSHHLSLPTYPAKKVRQG
jgi:antitoxin (DNA-binding transcriptional repressor) of toxin-antitoxin stability system